MAALEHAKRYLPARVAGRMTVRTLLSLGSGTTDAAPAPGFLRTAFGADIACSIVTRSSRHGRSSGNPTWQTSQGVRCVDERHVEAYGDDRSQLMATFSRACDSSGHHRPAMSNDGRAGAGTGRRRRTWPRRTRSPT